MKSEYISTRLKALPEVFCKIHHTHLFSSSCADQQNPSSSRLIDSKATEMNYQCRAFLWHYPMLEHCFAWGKNAGFCPRWFRLIVAVDINTVLLQSSCVFSIWQKLVLYRIFLWDEQRSVMNATTLHKTLVFLNAVVSQLIPVVCFPTSTGTRCHPGFFRGVGGEGKAVFFV